MIKNLCYIPVCIEDNKVIVLWDITLKPVVLLQEGKELRRRPIITILITKMEKLDYAIRRGSIFSFSSMYSNRI
jgi:hypothetical protein